MAVKLHRCKTMWAKVGAHPCWKVQKALDDAGLEYEVVKHPVLKGNRDDYEKLAGTRLLPAIQFEDGTVLREESNDLKKRIEEGRLTAPAAPSPTPPPA
jgi:hypothetical protein